jgi:hypothetical protein
VKRPPQKGESSSDSTVLAPRPEMTDHGLVDDDIDDDDLVFDEIDNTGETLIGRAKPKNEKPATLPSADISLIEAREQGPAASLDGLESPRLSGFGDGALLEDAAFSPSTEVLRLAFSDPNGAVEEGADDAPVEIQRWRAGLPQAGMPAPGHGLGDEAKGPTSPSAQAGPLPTTANPPPERPRAMFSIPSTEQGADAAGAPQAQAGGTRVDALSAGKAVVLDVDELRRTLEDAERLLKTVKQQVAGLDLEARGTNAQLAAALHRLSEALAMVRR